MKKIRKVRVVPPKYRLLDKGSVFFGISGNMSPSDVFYGLYRAFGRPEDKDGLSYIMRYENVVFEFCFGDDLKANVYIAPMLDQIAMKRRMRILNIIARKCNEENVVFMPLMDEKLYFAVGKKNAALYEKQKAEFSDEELRKRFFAHIGDDGVEKVTGSLAQYSPESEAIMREFIRLLKGIVYG